MRIQRLSLDRYGHFTDMSLALERPSSGYDLHLIVGPNEIGKSTIRQAVCDLLYGFPLRSTMGFVHAMSDLQVSAVIRAADKELAFARLKKNKDDLRSPDGSILTPQALLPFIGNTDRDLYERMFCFDRDQLQSSAQQMLEQNNSAGQILFESSTGIQGLHKYRQELEAAAEQFYAPKKKAGRVFYDALDEYKEAAKLVRELAQDASSYRQAKKAVEEARRELEVLLEEISEHRRRESQLKRVRLAGPILRDSAAVTAEIAELGEIIEFAPHSSEQFNEALRIISSETPAIEREQQKLEQLREDLKATPQDYPLLDGLQILEAFSQEVGGTSNYAQDLQTQSRLIKQAKEKIAGLCVRIGWDPVANQDPAVVLPKILPVQSLKAPANSIQPLRSGLVKHAERMSALIEEEQRLAAESTTLPLVPHREIVEALRHAERIMGNAADRREAQAKHEHFAQSVQERLAFLSPWQGSSADLHALNVLDESAATDARTEKLALQAKLDSVETALNGYAEDQAEAQSRIVQIRKDKRLIGQDELAALRESRDTLVERAFANQQDEVAKSQARELIVETDVQADERYVNAKEAHELAEAQRSSERLAASIRAVNARAKRLAEQIQDVDARWAQRMRQIGLEGLAIEQYSGWLGKRKAALEANDRAQEYQRIADRHGHEQSLAREAIIVAANKHKIQIDSAASLQLLTEHVSTLVASAQQAEARHRQASTDLAKVRRQIEELAKEIEKDKHALAAAERQWTEGVTKAGLNTDLGPEMLDEILGTVYLIDEQAADIQRRQNERIDTMQRDLVALNLRRQKLQAQFQLHDAPEDLGEFVAELNKRVQHETLAAAQRKRLVQMIEEAEGFVSKAKARVAQQQDKINELHYLAGTDSDEALRAALEAAQVMAVKRQALVQLERRLEDVSDGVSIAQLKADVEAIDASKISAQLLLLENETPALEARRQEALAAKIEAERALGQMEGSDAAFAAEARRVSAASQIQESIDQYLRLKTRARLLDWGIDWFRRERQGPVLKASSELFQKLTRGSFERLSVDVTAAAPTLTAVRSGLGNTDVRGLSEGARDQLYLALRLAAVAQHVTNSSPMPFVADDLFMAFDDQRAQAGFEALKTLSSSTQVIYFSHHSHLLDIAKVVLPDINIIDLS